RRDIHSKRMIRMHIRYLILYLARTMNHILKGMIRVGAPFFFWIKSGDTIKNSQAIIELATKQNEGMSWHAVPRAEFYDGSRGDKIPRERKLKVVRPAHQH